MLSNELDVSLGNCGSSVLSNELDVSLVHCGSWCLRTNRYENGWQNVRKFVALAFSTVVGLPLLQIAQQCPGMALENPLRRLKMLTAHHKMHRVPAGFVLFPSAAQMPLWRVIVTRRTAICRRMVLLPVFGAKYLLPFADKFGRDVPDKRGRRSAPRKRDTFPPDTVNGAFRLTALGELVLTVVQWGPDPRQGTLSSCRKHKKRFSNSNHLHSFNSVC